MKCENCKFFVIFEKDVRSYIKNIYGNCFFYPPKSEAVYYSSGCGIEYYKEIRPVTRKDSLACGKFKKSGSKK
jgi:hypothetical protein